jgi:uncharacterized membrane protein YjjB (DUF3815 family)
MMFDFIDYKWLMQFGFSTLAILGFSISSNVRGKKIIYTSLGGALTWGSYLLILNATSSLLLSVFLAVSIGCIYSELVARAFRVPVSIFVICAIIPLVPGSGLYYAMTAYIDGKMNQAITLMGQTLMIAGTISVAIATVSSVSNLFKSMLRRF